jgi:ribosomal protein S18 acetylase RimI-like enzyme
MGVDRDHRMRGLGALLLAHAQSWAAVNAALEWIDLEVLSTNKPAIRLYLQAGFSSVGEIPEMFKIERQPFSYTLMTKRIRGDAPQLNIASGCSSDGSSGTESS